MSGIEVGVSASLTAILFVIALACCAFLAFIETSITAIRLFTIDELERTVNGYRMLFSALRTEHHRVLTTILIANSFVHVLATMLSTRLSMIFLETLPNAVAIPLSLLFTTIMMLLCGEIIPKNLAQALGPQVIRSTLWITNALYLLLYPIVGLFIAITNKFISRLPLAQGATGHVISIDEVRFLIDHIHMHGSVSNEQRMLIQQAFSLTQLQLIDAVLPISYTPSISSSLSCQYALHHPTWVMSRPAPIHDETQKIIGLITPTLLIKHPHKTVAAITPTALVLKSSVSLADALQKLLEHPVRAGLVSHNEQIIGTITAYDIMHMLIGTSSGTVRSPRNSAVYPLTTTLSHITSPTCYFSSDSHTIFELLSQRLGRPPRLGDQIIYQQSMWSVQTAHAMAQLSVKIQTFYEEPVITHQGPTWTIRPAALDSNEQLPLP